MLNPDLKLNEHFLTGLHEREARDGFGEGLLEAGRADKNVVALTADLRDSVKLDAFARAFPERFFDVGVAEQNLVTVAAGLAVAGKIPFAASYAVFSPGRNWEQIRTTIAYNGANVKLVGSHAGLATGPDGATHQMTEDIALMRALPNMKVYSPCDALEAKRITEAMAKTEGPAYMRLSRDATPVMTTEETPFEFGKMQAFRVSKKPACAVFATGPILAEALVAADMLEEEGIQVEVLNVHCIKPLDERAVVSAAKKAGSVVSVEDHQIAGGLGSAIAEVLARKLPVPMEFVGVKDVFGESGKPKELWKKYGLARADIATAVKKAVERKENAW